MQTERCGFIPLYANKYIMSYNVYATPLKNSARIGSAFAKGAHLPYHEVPCSLFPGGMVSYGDAHGLRPLLARVQAEGRPWIYMDNGYFKAGHYKGYYRVTRNDYQHNGEGTHTRARWDALELRVRPWRKTGGAVLVCPPGQSFARHRGWDVSKWTEETLAELKKYTDRPLVVRTKPKPYERRKNSIQDACKGIWALVTYMSNTAVEALVEGIPVFCTGQCAAYRMGTHDLSKIETPLFPDDREQFFYNLAANQWTLNEMLRGQCWRELMS